MTKQAPRTLVQLNLRFPEEWLKMADELAEKLSTPDRPMSRSDALRAAFWAGLQQLSATTTKKGR
jgi:hypothetical protein